MVKIIYIISFAVTFFIPNGFSQSNNSNSVLLYAQNSGQVLNIPFLPSYVSDDTLSSIQIADDFSATSDWIIEQVTVIGDDDSINVDGFNIYIYADNNGVLGELVYFAANLPYISSFLYHMTYECRITFEMPVILPAGKYWISVQCHTTNLNWAWSWLQTNFNFGSIAMCKSGSPPSWFPVSTVYQTSFTEMNFELYGALLTPVELTTSVPSTYLLEQNYPNPFNPSTKIKYSIPQSSNVVLKVFDVLGEELTTLVYAEQPAGTYEVDFDASNLPSGTYFYQIKTGSFIKTKKMILMR